MRSRAVPQQPADVAALAGYNELGAIVNGRRLSGGLAANVAGALGMTAFTCFVLLLTVRGLSADAGWLRWLLGAVLLYGWFLCIRAVRMTPALLREPPTYVWVHEAGVIHGSTDQWQVSRWANIRLGFRISRGDPLVLLLRDGELWFTLRRHDRRLTTPIIDGVGKVVRLRAEAALARGEQVPFGSLTIGPRTLEFAGRSVPWSQVERLEHRGERLGLHLRGERRPAAWVGQGDVLDLPVAMALAEARTSAGRPGS